MKSNSPHLKLFRKRLRNHSTPAEIELWKYLKNRQIAELKFRRQHSIDNFILDFFCPQIKLGIELDGEQHIYNEEYDQKRDEILSSYNITILRYETSHESILSQRGMVVMASSMWQKKSIINT